MTILLSNEKEIKEFDYSQIESDLILKSNNDEFLNLQVKEQESVKCLYVLQREFATVTFVDPFIDIIGSDDATTCHIVLIVDETNQNSSLCHFDGTEIEEGLTSMIESLKSLNNDSDCEYSVYIVGGFEDNREQSINLSHQLFDFFINSKFVFNLKLCLVTKLNNEIINGINFPKVYGLGYNIKEKKVFMCNRFIEKGPDMEARSARHFSHVGNINIYDSNNYCLIIGPFDYKVESYIKQCIHLPKEILLKYFSSSPEQEPDHFINNLKQTFKFMLEHPKPLKTYFKEKTPNIYKKQENGSWQKY